jgi:hypothetical protein
VPGDRCVKVNEERLRLRVRRDGVLSFAFPIFPSQSCLRSNGPFVPLMKDGPGYSEIARSLAERDIILQSEPPWGGGGQSLVAGAGMDDVVHPESERR